MRMPFCLGLTILLAGTASMPTLAAKQKTEPVVEATIINTGSTNTTGYQIILQPSGRVRYAVTRRGMDVPTQVQHGQISRPQAAQFFRDLWAAMPLTELPAGHGMKSTSFGTSTVVVFKGQRSPDLSFPADAQARALKADVTAIAAALKLGNAPRRPAGPMTPMLP